MTRSNSAISKRAEFPIPGRGGLARFVDVDDLSPIYEWFQQHLHVFTTDEDTSPWACVLCRRPISAPIHPQDGSVGIVGFAYD